MAVPFPSFRVWPVPFAGGLLSLFAAARFEVDGGAAVIIALGGAFVTYLIWCGFLPRVRCWLCGGNEVITDGMGGERQRPCARCNRQRRIRRPGARLIGAVGRRE